MTMFGNRWSCVSYELSLTDYMRKTPIGSARAMRGNTGDTFWHQLRGGAARTKEGGARIYAF